MNARLPLRAWWPVLLMAAVLVAILSASIRSAGWVSNSLPLMISLMVGLAAGVALARTRWSWKAALGYHLALCGGVLLLLVSQALPLNKIGTLPAADFFWLMNARLAGLLGRMLEWVQTYFAGGSIKDPDAFTLLVGGALWSAGAWLGWCLLRRGRALPGLLPLGFLLALNMYLNQEAATTMLGFLMCSLVLVALTNWLREQQRWVTSRLDYSEDLGLNWIFSISGLTIVLAAMMWGASLLGTPQGWETLSRLLHRAEQEVGDPAGRIFGGVSTPEATDGSVAIKRPDLANIGEPINRDQQVVMWVKLSDPPPLPAEVAGKDYQPPPGHYWRSAIYAAYTGRGWEAAPPGGLLESFPAQGVGRYSLTQTFRIVARHDAALFAVGEPSDAPEGGALRSVAGGSVLLEGNLSEYSVVSWATRVSAEQLQSAGEDYPAEVLRYYLPLPPELPGRVRELSDRVTRGAGTPYEKALLIEAFLRTNYQYDPYVNTPPDGRDAVDYFLFDAPGGFCTYYASAMAVMLRAEGVPARVASGYLMGVYDREEGAYRVQGAASHTWVEVYFPVYGWVEFEPTSAFARIAYPGEEKAVPPKSAEIPRVDDLPGLRVALWTAGIITGLSLLWLVLRRLGMPGPLVLWARYQAHLAAVPQARGLYAQMRRELMNCGIPGHPGDTPYEFLARVEGPMPERHAMTLQEAARQVTEVYVQAQFSPRAPQDAQVRAARHAWQVTWWARQRVHWAHIWRARRKRGA